MTFWHPASVSVLSLSLWAGGGIGCCCLSGLLLATGHPFWAVLAGLFGLLPLGRTLLTLSRLLPGTPAGLSLHADQSALTLAFRVGNHCCWSRTIRYSDLTDLGMTPLDSGLAVRMGVYLGVQSPSGAVRRWLLPRQALCDLRSLPPDSTTALLSDLASCLAVNHPQALTRFHTRGPISG